MRGPRRCWGLALALALALALCACSLAGAGIAAAGPPGADAKAISRLTAAGDLFRSMGVEKGLVRKQVTLVERMLTVEGAVRVAHHPWLCRTIFYLSINTADSWAEARHDQRMLRAIEAACARFATSVKEEIEEDKEKRLSAIEPNFSGNINVTFLNQMANNLVQWSFARLVSQETGLKFSQQGGVPGFRFLEDAMPPTYAREMQERCSGPEAKVLTIKEEVRQPAVMLSGFVRLANNDPPCVNLLGWFQPYGLWADHENNLRDWVRVDEAKSCYGPWKKAARDMGLSLQLPAPQTVTSNYNAELSGDFLPTLRDFVVHLRVCGAPVGRANGNIKAEFYPPSPPEFIARVLTHDLTTWDRVIFVYYHRRVAQCRPVINKVQNAVKEATEAAGQPDKEFHQLRGESAVADFVYISKGKRLILSVGSYSWLAAILSHAVEIHSPMIGRQEKTITYTQPERWVYHDLVNRHSFGKYDTAKNRIVWASA